MGVDEALVFSKVDEDLLFLLEGMIVGVPMTGSGVIERRLRGTLFLARSRRVVGRGGLPRLLVGVGAPIPLIFSLPPVSARGEGVHQVPPLSASDFRVSVLPTSLFSTFASCESVRSCLLDCDFVVPDPMSALTGGSPAFSFLPIISNSASCANPSSRAINSSMLSAEVAAASRSKFSLNAVSFPTLYVVLEFAALTVKAEAGVVVGMAEAAERLLYLSNKLCEGEMFLDESSTEDLSLRSGGGVVVRSSCGTGLFLFLSVSFVFRSSFELEALPELLSCSLAVPLRSDVAWRLPSLLRRAEAMEDVV